MCLRVTVDEQLTIVAAEAAALKAPFNSRSRGARPLERLAGLARHASFLRKASQPIGVLLVARISASCDNRS
jgi:hypothetical protein